MGIVDGIVIIFFIAILAFFVIGFNRQMMQKHKERLQKNEEGLDVLDKDKIDE